MREQTTMDKIIIKDLEVKACHGCNPEEKVNPQRFLFSAEIFYDFSQAANADDLTKTISYSDVKKTLTAFCVNNCFDLIETLATKSAELIIKKYLAQKVVLTLKKPDAPMSGVFDFVGVQVEKEWHEVYLALGSNMGDKNAYLDFAIARLSADDNIKEVVESSRYSTAPYGGVATGEFVNSAARIFTLYTPSQLLAATSQIEKDGERVRTEHWGNRTLDIDIVFYDDCVIGTKDLCVPHVDMQNRSFVLDPLCELCPNKVHPLLKQRVFELKNALKTPRI